MEMMNLRGKRILFLGSSVTFGSGAGGISFADYLAEQDCICPIKEAVSGTTLVDNGPDSYIARMKNMERPERIDLFICQLSTNDATRGEPLGEVSEGFAADQFDTKTIAGAIEYIISWARETYGCPVAFYTNPRYESPAYLQMVNLLQQIRKKWSIDIIDLWNDAAFCRAGNQNRGEYMVDPIHPTALGYREWWTPYFASAISQILN